MAKNSVSDWDTIAANNTDIGGISLAEGVTKAPAVNNAFREMMAQLKTEFGGLTSVPPGAVAYFGMSSAPTGWLKANGAAVSRSTYSSLFSAIGTTFGSGDGSTTFNLPDLRGEFLRALDDGRGVDSARALGSAQSGQNASHTHTGTTDSGGSHTHTGSAASSGAHSHTVASGATDSGANTGQVAYSSTNPDTVSTSSSGAHTHTLSIDSGGAHTHTFTTASSGGTEARPRNIALLACIKY